MARSLDPIRPQEPEGQSGTPPTTGVGRRRFLRLGGLAAAGVAAGAVASIADASPAAAGGDGDVVLGSSDNAATFPTGIGVSGTTAAYGFGVTDNGASTLNDHKPSLFAHAKGTNFVEALYVLGEADASGIVVETNISAAISASSTTAGPVVAASQNGTGVVMNLFGNTDDGLYVDTGGAGRAIVALSEGSGAAIEADADGSGIALLARTRIGTNASPAIVAASGGSGGAMVAFTGGHAVAPVIQASSGSPQPALRATGKAVPVSTSVPLAGNSSALSVQGVASFTRSGVAVLGASSASVVVSVPGGLNASSHVLATMQTNNGTVSVRAAVPNPANGRITIYLTAAAPAGAKIGWFVFG